MTSSYIDCILNITMTVASGIGLFFIGIPVTFLTFYVLLKAQEHFDKERQKDEDTTTRHY